MLMLKKFIVSAAAICALWTAGAVAQDYPNKPIQLLVAFPPGGNTDLMARAIAPELSKALGQSVVVVNKGGAGGVVGSTDAARARPDGYTVLLSPNSPLTLQSHLQKVEYKLDSFRFVCLTYDNSFVLMGGPQAPFKTYQEFVAFAKAKPNNVVYASSGGPGSMPHLLFLEIFRSLGSEGVHLPFPGAGPMVQAVLGGTAMITIESPAVATANNLPIFAVFSENRVASMPNVPTAKELGIDLKGFSAGGLMVPAGTPDAVVEKLDAACSKAVKAPEFEATMKKLNAAIRYLPSKEFQKLFTDDSARNFETIKRAGMLPK
jgi:tripartite-type tricarboxylate transporter receptor subunit TctC